MLAMLLAGMVAVIPAKAQDSPETRHRAAVTQLGNDGFNQGRTDVVAELLAPDFVQHSPNGDGGPERVIGAIQMFRTAMPDLTVTPLLVIADGDYVASINEFVGTFDGPFFTPQGELPPTGQPIRFVTQTIHRFNADGLIAEEWVMFDNLGLLTQVGAMGAPPASAEGSDTEAVIVRFYDLYNSGDYDAQMALYAEDATLTQPDGTVVQGRDAIRLTIPEHGEIVISELVVDGDTACWTSHVGANAWDLEAVVEDGLIQSMRFR